MSTTESAFSLAQEIAAYEEMQDHLEEDYFGTWVVFRNSELIGSYGSYEDADADTRRRFGDGLALIRLVGRGPDFIPSTWGGLGKDLTVRAQLAGADTSSGGDPYDDPDSLQSQVRAYDEMRLELESKCLRKWSVFHHSQFRGAFDSFEDADSFARRSFGASRCFIWRVGLPFNQSSTLVTHHHEHADR